jgi:hypothetical protein
MSIAADLKKVLGDVPVLKAAPDSTVRVSVEVSQMTIPYTVAYAGQTVIKSLVNRSELIDPLQPGAKRLGWAFAHVLKGWKHEITIKIDNRPKVVLESRSEANKDQDHSVGVAFLVVE